LRTRLERKRNCAGGTLRWIEKGGMLSCAKIRMWSRPRGGGKRGVSLGSTEYTLVLERKGYSVNIYFLIGTIEGMRRGIAGSTQQIHLSEEQSSMAISKKSLKRAKRS